MKSPVVPGTFVNPGNEVFARARTADIFVDKSGLIHFTNNLLGKARNKICVTRPNGFGKSWTIEMLAAYYSCGADSSCLFQDLEIAQSPASLAHLNRHNVIRLRLQDFWEPANGKAQDPIAVLQRQVIRELQLLFPKAVSPKDITLSAVLPNIHRSYPGTSFLFLVDDWDVPFRSAKVSAKRKLEYLAFLISLFKGPDVEECIDLVFLTGILPVIRYLEGASDQSMLNNVEEYSMLMPDALAQYVCFTASEAAGLCAQWDMPLALLREWYGYPLSGPGAVYCPASVVSALTCRHIRPDWSEFSAPLAAQDYINPDLPELREAADALLAGESVAVDTTGFLNTPSNLFSVDDVLTLLIHYGCLSYQPRDESAFDLEPWKDGIVAIPNRVAHHAFQMLVRSLQRDA